MSISSKFNAKREKKQINQLYTLLAKLGVFSKIRWPEFAKTLDREGKLMLHPRHFPMNVQWSFTCCDASMHSGECHSFVLLQRMMFRRCVYNPDNLQ